MSVVLDELNDQCNLGTIIRLCDWFGVNNVFCSKGTVDCYNSKVVQSSMGSLARVAITYTDIFQLLSNSDKPVLLAEMNGENVYHKSMPNEAYLVMGNEANGIGKEIFSLKHAKISIPKFGSQKRRV